MRAESCMLPLIHVSCCANCFALDLGLACCSPFARLAMPVVPVDPSPQPSTELTLHHSSPHPDRGFATN